MRDIEGPIAAEWRAVVGFEGFYEVSSLGDVRSCARSHSYADKRVGFITRSRQSIAITRKIGSNGYCVVMLSRDAKSYCRTVHSLVAQAFLGLPAEGQEVRHLDGRRVNNVLANLAYGTKLENAADKDRHGTTCRGEKSSSCKLSDFEALKLLRDRASGMVYSELIRKYKISRSQVSNICRGKRHISDEARHAS